MWDCILARRAFDSLRAMFLRLLFATSAACAVAFAQEKPAPPEFTGELQLVRYDMPRGLSDGYSPTRQLAKRKDGPDAIDWPMLTLGGKPAFRLAPVERMPLRLRRGEEARAPLQQRSDEVIQPGNHWFRPIAWLANRKHLYTADATARCSATGIDASGRYELWLFPLRIESEGGPQVKNVIVKNGGAVVFQKAGPLRSLTLLLPASEAGKPYEITVDGRGPVKCAVGLQPVKLGTPTERALAVDARVPGDGPKVRVFTPVRPEEFPNPKEWAADEAALAKAESAALPAVEPVAARRQTSPITLYAAALPHGMSGGFWKKGANTEDSAAQIATLGFDTIFEPAATLPEPADAASFETRAAAFARRGVRLGLHYDQSWTRPNLQHPDLALLAHTLPEWHQPLYRSLQLAAQRFARVPGFAGLMIGGDLPGYASLAPGPERPRGEATLALGSARADTAFRQFGYFAEAVSEAAPGQILTTAASGATPERIVFEGLRVQQAHDAGGTHSSRPLRLVALLDRLRSQHPAIPTWALVDDTKLFFGREAMQRAYALALTRGVRGIGTNFPATAGVENMRPEAATTQGQLNAWMERYGGAYAAMLPEAPIGIFAGERDAVATEALWLCHAAGWPARLVTYQEIARAPLPPSMHALIFTTRDDAARATLEPMLKHFTERGGRILRDEDAGLRLADYPAPAELDPTPLLLARNADNVGKLRAALDDLEPPAAVSSDPLAWAVPSRVKDTLYITAVNWAFAEGDEAKEYVHPADPRAARPEVWKTKANASLYVKPRTATLAWHTTRPIYDVRQQRRLTAEEAARVDFTKDGFQWFALPQAEPATVTLAAAEPGRMLVQVLATDGSPLRGVPVEIAVFHDDAPLTKISAVSEDTVPVGARGANRAVATELLSGLVSEPAATQPAPARAPRSTDTALEKFAARKTLPLVVALTPAQEKDPALVAAVKQIVARFEKAGRKARIGLAAPGGVVVSLQPLRSPHRFPQWKTVPADLVLIGTPQSNLLILDQLRGEIFPRTFAIPGAGQASAVITKSAFAGECDVLNLVARDAAGVQAWLAAWK